MRDRKVRWYQGSSPMPGRSCSINIKMPFQGWEQGRKQTKGVERGLDCCIVLVIYHHRSQQCHIHRSRGDQERAWCWPLLTVCSRNARPLSCVHCCCLQNFQLTFQHLNVLQTAAGPRQEGEDAHKNTVKEATTSSEDALSSERASVLTGYVQGFKATLPALPLLRNKPCTIASLPPPPTRTSVPFCKTQRIERHLLEPICCIEQAQVCEKCKIIIQATSLPP